MVGRGEVLERMTVVDGPQGTLEALWQAGGIDESARTTPVLLCPPHPRLGGNMDSAVLGETVWTLARARHPTLRFNYAGVSASQGAIALPPLPTQLDVDVTPLVDDARAALAQLLQSTNARDIAVVGVSVGAVVAMQLALHDEAVTTCVLVAPVSLPGAAIDWAALGRGHRMGCPVTVVCGGADVTASVDSVRAACEPAGLSVVCIDGADHGFSRGLTACARAVASALGDVGE